MKMQLVRTNVQYKSRSKKKPLTYVKVPRTECAKHETFVPGEQNVMNLNYWKYKNQSILSRFIVTRRRSLQRTKQRKRRVRYKRRARIGGITRKRNKRYWKKRRNKARMVERRREKIDEERRDGFRSVRVIFTKSLCL